MSSQTKMQETPRMTKLMAPKRIYETTITSKNDRISKLPDLVISHILFYLPVKDAARTTILSKNWLRLWHSLPARDFVFDQSLFENNLRLREESEEKDKVQKFVDFVNESLSILLHRKIIVLSFTLNMIDYKDSSSYHCVIMDWLILMTKHRVRKLTLNKVSTRPLLELGSLRTNQHFGYAKFFRRLNCLRELSLAIPRINKNMKIAIDYLLRHCSSLETLVLKGNTYRQSDCPLDLSRFRVKNLRVENVFKLFLSYAIMHQVQLSSPDLQVLLLDTTKIRDHEVVIDIDAPKLRWLSYIGNVLPSFTSDELNFPCLENCQLTIPVHHVLNILWFVRLREYLEKLSNVCLTIDCGNPTLFQGYETMSLLLEGSGEISSPPKIRLLKIHCHQPLLNYEDLVDGLLWSCRPDTVKVYASDKKDTLVELLSRELMKIEAKETLSCCRDPQRFRCWRHYARVHRISKGLDDRLLDAGLHWSH